MPKRTSLFAAHQKLGARLIDFGGWEMPVQYSGIVDEHLAVRGAAGIFDISHMGEIFVNGVGAERFLNRVLTNDVRKLHIGLGQYTLLCNERGGVVDDLYIYRTDANEYLLVVNASRIEADFAWIERQWTQFAERDSVELTNASDSTAAVAIQGPRVAEFIPRVLPGSSIGGTQVASITGLIKNQLGQFVFEGKRIWVGRTGYTGEDGFEVVTPADAIETIWEKLLQEGANFGIKPCGLGARDTLRTEVCYPLYGHELDEDTTPMEAGLGFFVAFDKGDFIGREPLLKQKSHGVSKKLVAFKMTEKSAPPRAGYPIWTHGEESARAGLVTSGTQSPSLNVGIGLGYVATELAKPGTQIEIEIRGRRSSAVIVRKPICKKT